MYGASRRPAAIDIYYLEEMKIFKLFKMKKRHYREVQ